MAGWFILGYLLASGSEESNRARVPGDIYEGTNTMNCHIYEVVGVDDTFYSIDDAKNARDSLLKEDKKPNG